MHIFYTRLQVDQYSTIEDIKSAYRREAKKYHPDVNKNPDAVDVFRKLTEAYDWLSTNHVPEVRPVDRKERSQVPGIKLFRVIDPIHSGGCWRCGVTIPQVAIDSDVVNLWLLWDFKEFCVTLEKGTPLPYILHSSSLNLRLTILGTNYV